MEASSSESHNGRTLPRHHSFCGCAFGLKSTANRTKNVPITKPWANATDCPSLVQAFSGKRCPGKVTHPEHAQCRGCDTAASGFYTRPLCALIHKVWQRHVHQRNRVHSALVAEWAAGDSPAALADDTSNATDRTKQHSNSETQCNNSDTFSTVFLFLLNLVFCSSSSSNHSRTISPARVFRLLLAMMAPSPAVRGRV